MIQKLGSGTATTIGGSVPLATGVPPPPPPTPGKIELKPDAPLLTLPGTGGEGDAAAAPEPL